VTPTAEGGAGGARPLRVAIDGRELEPAASPTGVSRYLRCLLSALEDDPEVEVRMLGAGPPVLGPHLFMPLRARLDGVDVLHGPANGLPLVRLGTPAVVTVHDLAIYEHPEWFPDRQWLSTRVLVPAAVQGARIVICPSQATRSGLARHLGVPPDKCRVIAHGVEAEFAAPIDPARMAAVRARLGLPDHYWLQVGTVQPRKNYEATLSALARLPASERLPLLIVGSLGWKYEPVLRAVQDLGLSTHVRLLGAVDPQLLPAVYRMADVLAFPSLDEGFGLPVLEAFASGLPVVAARRGAISEVAEGAAVLVEPHDHAALAEALVSLTRDGALRERNVAAGRARALEYTWDRSARAHVDAYRVAAA
jgi:glycosyltransferase involved in cell wall biosynthesis